jgi:hypothetical protein
MGGGRTLVEQRERLLELYKQQTKPHINILSIRRVGWDRHVPEICSTHPQENV